MAPPARVSNPFYFGDLALNEAFTDRQDELRALETDLLKGQNVALSAPRRYGQSSPGRRATPHLVAGDARAAGRTGSQFVTHVSEYREAVSRREPILIETLGYSAPRRSAQTR